MAENKENLKRFANRKVMVAVGMAISLFVSIVVMTLVQANFDLEKALSNTSVLIINAAICIASIICGYYLFQNFLYNNPNGEYQMSAIAFRKARFEYEKNANQFADWHNEIYYPQERKAELENVLRKNGIQQMEVLELDSVEIKQLLNQPKKFGEKYYMSLTEKQIDILLKIKSGKINVEKLPDDYFYDIRGMFSNRRAYIQAGKEGISKSGRFAYQVITKMIMGIIITSVFAGLIVNTDDVDNTQRWINLLTRIYTMLSNMFYGYIVAVNTVRVELYFIKYKTHVLQLFNVDIKDGFKGKTLEEKAKEEFENEHKNKVLD